jgi:2'-5' RNA ligase
MTGISEALTKYSAFAAGEFVCKELVLFQSKLSPQGATYTKLAEFALSV